MDVKVSKDDYLGIVESELFQKRREFFEECRCRMLRTRSVDGEDRVRTMRRHHRNGESFECSWSGYENNRFNSQTGPVLNNGTSITGGVRSRSIEDGIVRRDRP